MTINTVNPYVAPTVSSCTPNRSVYRYTELPRSCPVCGRKFSDLTYRRLYPTRYRWRTIAFLGILTIVALGLIGWLGLIAAPFLGSRAVKWNKKVRVHCPSCKWSQKFIVSVRAKTELLPDYAKQGTDEVVDQPF